MIIKSESSDIRSKMDEAWPSQRRRVRVGNPYGLTALEAKYQNNQHSQNH